MTTSPTTSASPVIRCCSSTSECRVSPRVPSDSVASPTSRSGGSSSSEVARRWPLGTGGHLARRRGDMGRFILRRLLQGIPTLFGVTLISFALWRFSPGDPVSRLVFGAQNVTAEEIAALRHFYGLDQSLPEQYLSWLGRIVHLDFGQSFLYHRPVTDMIMSALPNTLQLALVSLTIALVIGIPLGVVAARSCGSFIDHVVRVLDVAGHAIRHFWSGYLFMHVLV